MNNKWIEHTHDMCPVRLDVLVQVRTLNDPTGLGYETAPAGDWLWELKEQNRITHYRLVEQQSSGTDNEWIKFTGVSCPVDTHSLVEVRTLNDPTGLGYAKSAGLWYWGVRPNSITHYRVVQSAPSSGGDNDYYVADITNPKRLEPCRVECEDVIQALGMTFGQGEAFKAIWRDAAARMGNGKPGDTAIRNAEKVIHYGEYMKRDAQNENGK